MLVDTSVWVDHLRRRNATLVALLEQTQVWTHAFVVGELACGNLAQRDKLPGALIALPHAPMCSHEEVLAFLASHRLMGRGLGWVDVHLLASARGGQQFSAAKAAAARRNGRKSGRPRVQTKVNRLAKVV